MWTHQTRVRSSSTDLLVLELFDRMACLTSWVEPPRWWLTARFWNFTQGRACFFDVCLILSWTNISYVCMFVRPSWVWVQREELWWTPPLSLHFLSTLYCSSFKKYLQNGGRFPVWQPGRRWQVDRSLFGMNAKKNNNFILIFVFQFSDFSEVC